MHLLPITPDPATQDPLLADPACQEILAMTLAYYEAVGYAPPWISYFAVLDGRVVGSGAFKGGPQQGQVEIAYMTFDAWQHRGIGTDVCRLLVALARRSDPDLRITARTLPTENYSTRILRNNGFVLLGTVEDPEDSEVWNWEYRSDQPH
ncbi:MAG: hypothetical protein OHK0039_21890 [Bacteroidia bacterium]